MEPKYSVGQEVSFCCGKGDPLAKGRVRVISPDISRSGAILYTVDLLESDTSYEVEEYNITCVELLLVSASWVSDTSIML